MLSKNSSDQLLLSQWIGPQDINNSSQVHVRPRATPFGEWVEQVEFKSEQCVKEDKYYSLFLSKAPISALPPH